MLKLIQPPVRILARIVSVTVVTCLLLYSALVHSAVRFNPYTQTWEGNICYNPQAWTYVVWQPIGSFCAFRLSNGMVMQGIVVNQ